MRLCGHFHPRQSACEVALWHPELGTGEQRKRKMPTGVSGEQTDPGLNLEKWVWGDGQGYPDISENGDT